MHLLAQTADKLSNKRVELKTIQSKISATNKNLSHLQNQQQDVYQQLAEIDKQSAQLALVLKDTQQQIEIKNRIVQESKLAIAQQKKAIDSQKNSLAQQLNAAYRIGKHDHLKLLLNQEDLALSSRVLVYFEYLNKIRSQKVKQIAGQLEQLAQLEAKQEHDSFDLSEALKQQKRDQTQLLEMKRTRTALLEQIKGKYHTNQLALLHLRDDERRLIALLDILHREAEQQRQTNLKQKLAAHSNHKSPSPSPLTQEQNSDQQINKKTIKQNDVALQESKQEHATQDDDKIRTIDSLDSGKAFNQLRGQLTWPTHGKLLKTFGSARSEGRWDGVLIGAPTGQGVRAVAEGRVVYAAWLRSYGLLMIVNHGSGYMSVYAFNESLYKGVGAKVKTGDVIASVGQSGGQSESALYFEIRDRGKPLDPALWCKK